MRVTFILSVIAWRVNLYRYVFLRGAQKLRGGVACIFLAHAAIRRRNNAYPAQGCGRVINIARPS